MENILANFPRIALTELPTPVTRLARLSRHYGRHIFCKRDDLTGFAFGGNKTRKLEFLLANAQQAGVDTVIAVGAIQSNFCRVAAAAAVRMGIDCHLILGGPIPRFASGNVILDELLGARLNFCESENWQDWEDAADQLAEKLRLQGCNVYRMPMGGSTPVGTLGYVAGFAEMMADARRMRTEVDHIIVASSTGGTQAGLLVGKAICGWHGQIHGISVANNKVELASAVFGLARATAEMLGVEVSARDIVIDDTFVGAGYGFSNETTLQAIREFAELEGIFLDRVYTGKAASALLEYLENEIFSPNEVVMFLHTGGSVELFAKNV